MTFFGEEPMNLVVRSIVVSLSVGCGACVGPSWSSELPANGRQVALALNDPMEMPAKSFDPLKVPVFPAPSQVRPCCVFGMDMKAKVGEMPVPGYQNKNVLSVEELGKHGYGDAMHKEGNGIVYTCRGGFIDVAHIRDNADRMLYLATQIARSLPASFSVELPAEGLARHVVVKPIPEALMRSPGRWAVASAIAEWAGFQLSVWHEIITWYGWESTPGFSEKISAFTPEDLYSNVLGQRLAAGIIVNRELRSREEYNAAMDAWMAEALRRLGVVTKDATRRALGMVDGLWWDSKKRIPDWKLVTRRSLAVGFKQTPWLLSDAFPADVGDSHVQIRDMCAGTPPVLPLEVATRIGDTKIEDLVSIELEVGSWTPKTFPMALKKGDKLHPSDFPALIAAIRSEAERELGADFEKPRASQAQQSAAHR